MHMLGSRQQGSSVDGSLNVQAPWGSSMFLLFLWKLVERSKQCLLSYSTIQQNRGNPTKASGMLIIQIFTPIISPAIVPKMLVGIYKCKQNMKDSASAQNTIVAFYWGYYMYCYLYFTIGKQWSKDY